MLKEVYFRSILSKRLCNHSNSSSCRSKYLYPWLLLGYVFTVTNASVLVDQYNALQRIYWSLGGPYWTYDLSGALNENKVWLNKYQPDPCYPEPWYGLGCSEDNTTIINITLREFNLVGTMQPNTFEGLNTTVYMDWYNNSISGELPKSLTASRYSLVYLDLGRNLLSGTIPTWISEFAVMERFYVNQNMLTGAFPTGLCELSTLHRFQLYFNKLSGSLPSCVGNITNVTHFSVGNNAFTGTIPNSLYECQQLRYLDLQSNFFVGPLVDLFQFPRLEYTYFQNNSFGGRIYNNITYMQNLIVLGLSENRFTGTIPVNIGNMTALEGLYLYQNFLVGPVPQTISSLDRLQIMLIRDNELTGTIPIEIGYLKDLLYLDISNNKLSGEAPSALFTSMVSLELLVLSGNGFTGQLPSMEYNLQLNQFDASNNRFTGEIPITLMTLPNLTLLSCAVNCLSLVISSSICETTSIQQLYLSGLSRSPSCSSLIDKYFVKESKLPTCIW